MYFSRKLFIFLSLLLWTFGFLTGLLIQANSGYFCESSGKRCEDQTPPVKRVVTPGTSSSSKDNQADNVVASKETTVPPSVAKTEDSAKMSLSQNLTLVLSDKKFSIIIPTYKRIKLLKKVLENYCSLSTHVDTIIVVWNNVKEKVPQELKDFSCQVTLHVKAQKVNSLNNRFLHFPEIKTQAVMSADDDLLITHEDLIFQFETWKQFKHLIVGFAPRKHVEQPKGSARYLYGGPPKDGDSDRRYSFILTTSAMFHVKYLDLYQSQLPKHFREFVDKNMNCEDIFLNAIVADHLQQTSGKQCPALLVPYKEIKMIEGENKGYKGLWSRPKHKKVRHECLKLILKQYNGMPFEYSTLKITTA